MEVKVFGGGVVFVSFISSNVGVWNVEFVFDYLKIEKIFVVVKDLLDLYLCKVYYFL